MTGLNYGVLGCGEHARRGHIIHAPKGMRLVAMFDPSEEQMVLAAQAAGDMSVARLCSDQELLGRADVQAVLIMSPDHFHPAQLLAAVEAGKHVLVDKPLAIDAAGLETVRDALRIATTNGLVVTSCHPRRFDPPYVWLKEELSHLEEDFGALVHVEMDFSYVVPPEEWQRDRSLLHDHFPHEIDWLRYLLGDLPFSAQRQADSFDRYRVSGSIERPGQTVTFACMGTRRLPKGELYTEWVRMRFENGDCELDTKTGLVLWRDHNIVEEPTTRIAVATDYGARCRGVMDNFLGAVKGTREGYLTHPDLIVINESANTLHDGGEYSYRP